MAREPARSRSQRIADARRILEAAVTARQGSPADVWVASASAEGRPHLIPLSFVWDGSTVTIALQAATPTARNIAATGRARLAFGTTRDVVMVDAVLDRHVPVAEADDELVERYAAEARWNPREEDEEYVFQVLRPWQIQVWRESNEIAGRTVMRDGEWLA